MQAAKIRTKRIYEPAQSEDGCRVLVDRLWPRGLTREAAAIDAWVPQLAPSAELRRWFGSDVERWSEFERRYRSELATPELVGAIDELLQSARVGTVTLLFAKRDALHNNAVVLRDVLMERLART